jgi:hypothetical protein
VKISKDQRVLCVCRRGEVRSVAVRSILTLLGFRKVLACGWETNDEETFKMLVDWADVVLVVGSEWAAPYPLDKTVLLDIGPDVWGRHNHPDLVHKLLPLIKGLME